MQIISTQDFATDINRYFDLARQQQQILVENGNYMFQIVYKPIIEKDVVFEPDADFYNSISMETVRERLHKVVDKLYAK